MKSPEFFEQNPADPNTANAILKTRERLKPNEHPLVFLANDLIRYGNVKLREVDSEVFEAEGNTPEVPGKIWEKGASYISQIVFGSLVVGVVDAKISGRLYVAEAVNRISNGFSATLAPRLNVSKDIVKERGLDESEIREFGHSDETYSDLFEDAGAKLPIEFRKILTMGNGSLIPYINDIASKWRDLASLVLDEYNAKVNGIPSEMRDNPEFAAMISAGLTEKQISALVKLSSEGRPLG